MKITIYELLGLIKEGKTPKKIKWNNHIYIYDEHYDDYFEETTGLFQNEMDNGMLFKSLNDEIEIIEEEKEIEKIKWDEKSLCQGFMSINKVEEMLMHRSEQLKKSLNQLIDEISKLKKGNDDISIR